MRSLVLEDDRRLAWHEVPEPERLHEREAIVRPIVVATCDLDQPVIFGRVPLAKPIRLGHECVAEVIEGPDRFSAGELVVVPFQISCGTCDRCVRGLTGNCASVAPLSAYGFGPLGGDWGGMLSDFALVPYADAMLVPLPPGVQPTTAVSAADNIPDGWRAVAPALAEHPAADVLIVGGGGSIALYAVDAALALGAASVTYVDTDAARLDVAGRLGATVVGGRPERSLGTFPITVDGTGTVDGLVATLRLTEWGGRCTSIAQLAPEGTLPLSDIYTRGVQLQLGRAMARPAIPAILDLIAVSRLRPNLVTTATVSWGAAAEALLEPATKLIMHRS